MAVCCLPCWEHMQTIWLSSFTPKYKPKRNACICSPKDMHRSVHSRTVCNRTNLESIPMPIKSKINKLWSININYGPILHSHKNEDSTTTCNNRNDSQGHYFFSRTSCCMKEDRYFYEEKSAYALWSLRSGCPPKYN